MDKYTKKFILAIKKVIGKADEEAHLSRILDRVYEDGFYDGQQELKHFDPNDV